MWSGTIRVCERIGRVCLVLAAAVVASQCTNEVPEQPAEPQAPQQVETKYFALGEPVDGLPGYEERTLHHMTNRVRAGLNCGSPGLTCPGAPLPPLQWNHNLGKAAHWFAKHLHDAGCFQHRTCCYLVKSGSTVKCNGGYTCPYNSGQSCAFWPECAGTSTFDRVLAFGPSPSPWGENLAGGDETAKDTICSWYFSPGHHDAMCAGAFGSVGAGHYGGYQCYDDYWVLDFGGSIAPRGIASGSHWYEGGLAIGASFYDPASQPPMLHAVVVGGVCYDMPLELGTNKSGAYKSKQVPAGSGCNAYWFLFESQDGALFAYPNTGSFLVGPACTGNYIQEQVGANCLGGKTVCVPGETMACYEGPAASYLVGECKAGNQTCSEGKFGTCQSQTLPSEEVCSNGKDDDCDGTIDEPECKVLVNPDDQDANSGGADSGTGGGADSGTEGDGRNGGKKGEDDDGNGDGVSLDAGGGGGCHACTGQPRSGILLLLTLLALWVLIRYNVLSF